MSKIWNRVRNFESLKLGSDLKLCDRGSLWLSTWTLEGMPEARSGIVDLGHCCQALEGRNQSLMPKRASACHAIAAYSRAYGSCRAVSISHTRSAHAEKAGGCPRPLLHEPNRVQRRADMGNVDQRGKDELLRPYLAARIAWSFGNPKSFGVIGDSSHFLCPNISKT